MTQAYLGTGLAGTGPTARRTASLVRRARGLHGPSRRRRFALGVFVLIGIAGGGAGAWLSRSGPSFESLMGLQPLTGRAAPNFVLTDQSGARLSLTSFRGKAVALYFMDPRCIDVCPLVAAELERADRELGGAAARVALVGVDVNPEHLSVRSLRRFDAEHGLDRLTNWYFLTGPLGRLRSVWGAYGITVQLAPATGAVTHSTVMDFIGPRGRERYMATPWSYLRADGTGYLPAADISGWGRGIAVELRRLLVVPHA